ILFPKWKTALEEESLQALKEQRYEDALKKLNELIGYQITNHEIYIGKLICLIELGGYDEAERLCESLIEFQDEHYYHYLHIYLTILLQKSQYSLLMEYVENELTMKSIPQTIREQFTQLYELSSKMKQDVDIEKGKAYEIELQEAFEQGNYQAQWRIIEAIRKIKMKPPHSLIQSLQDNKIHPIIKTSIIHWLQDLGESVFVHIHKFGLELFINPIDIPSIESNPMTKQIMLIFTELEQQDPSLHQLLEQLLFRYLYVRYPFYPPTEDILSIANALKTIGMNYMNLQSKEEKQESKVTSYIEEIELFQTLYLSIIED